MRSQDAGQHDLADHAGRRNPLIGRIIVAGCYGHGQIEAGKYKEPLAAIADRTPEALEPRAVPPGPVETVNANLPKYQWYPYWRISSTSTMGEVERSIHSAGTTRRSPHIPPFSIIEPMRARSRGVMRKPDAAIASPSRSVNHSVGPIPRGSNKLARAKSCNGLPVPRSMIRANNAVAPPL